jgi:hypothetical protein
MEHIEDDNIYLYEYENQDDLSSISRQNIQEISKKLTIEEFKQKFEKNSMNYINFFPDIFEDVGRKFASENKLHRPKKKMRQNKWLKENKIIPISGEEPIFITMPFLALGVIFLVVSKLKSSMKLPYYFILQVSTLFNLYKLILVGFKFQNF